MVGRRCSMLYSQKIKQRNLIKLFSIISILSIITLTSYMFVSHSSLIEDAEVTVTPIEGEEGIEIDISSSSWMQAEDTETDSSVSFIESITDLIEGYPNPKFTVQYYANLEVVAYNDPALRKVIGSTSYTNELPVIDTTGGKLPANGGGSTASPNGNEIRNLYVDMTTGKLQTKTELTEIYSSRPFEYYKAPTINYMNALVENVNYKLKEVWVLKEGEESDSTDRNDWDIHTYSSDLHFTNREVSAESGEYVFINDGATLRFVYDTTVNDHEFEAAFYDYDIGDGMIYSTQLNAQKQTNGKPTSTQGSGTYHMHTNQSGINSPGNYTGSGAKLAFGNANTGSGLQHELWGGNLLNKANQTQSGHPSVTGSYKGCTFGLVTGLVDGKIQYAGNVNAPNLFNDGSAAGKTSYDNGEFSLTFNRVGDTYTLTTVNGTGTGDLDTFNHPSPNASTVHNHIWTNNFWPMDSAASFGTDGHDMKFGDYTNRENYKFAGQAGSSGGSAAANGTFPWSDDGEDHNSYFGMYYKVEFDLVEDYVGPLEYYFFGDDDMWVFLDGRLVEDIGGVHSSVGEYVNLWDYLEKGSEESAGKHTLYFFYTERGESGSTCWMQFSLPSTSSLTPETSDEDYGHLKVEKTVTQVDEGKKETIVDSDEEFKFTISFTDENGNHLPDDYSYVKYDKDGNEIEASLVIWDGGEFTLKNGEYIIVKFLPNGTRYTITEEEKEIEKEGFVGYYTDITEYGSETETKTDLYSEKIAEGEIFKGLTVDVKYNNKFYPIKDEVSPGNNSIVAQGDEIIYEIKWANGSTENSAVTITDTLDENLELIGISFKQSSDNEWIDINSSPYNQGNFSASYNKETRQITWVIKNTTIGYFGVVSIKAKVNDESTDVCSGTYIIKNQSQWSIDDRKMPDSNVIENPVWCPIKTVENKEAEEGVAVEEPIVYRVTWKNYKDTAATIKVIDPLDAGLTYVVDTAKAYYSDGKEVNATITYDVETHTITWDLGSQASHSEGYVEFTGQVNNNARIKQVVVNKAEVLIDEKSLQTEEVINSLILMLPNTGNAGGLVLTLVGVVIIGIAIYLITKKKK